MWNDCYRREAREREDIVFLWPQDVRFGRLDEWNDTHFEVTVESGRRCFAIVLLRYEALSIPSLLSLRLVRPKSDIGDALK